MTTVDLDSGVTETVHLADGSTAKVRVLSVTPRRDSICNAIRNVEVVAEINGERVTLGCANYRLPVSAGGVQVDCPVVGEYRKDSNGNTWAIGKDVRLRLWPDKSPWMPPGAMIYPVKQRWFASGTQMSNEPTYVDGGDTVRRKAIYYHTGLDIGGAEGLIEVVAATDGTLAQLGTTVAPGHEGSAVRPRYDVIYLLDERGWYYRYSHLHSFAPGLKVGQRIRQGQKLGLLGKEGASGGWSHLHFEIMTKQASGEWGTHEGYAFLWEAYQRQFQPDLIAVARPHVFAKTGETVRLDATRSWSKSGKVAKYEWTLDSGEATGTVVETSYARPGAYSEMLKITDGAGRVSYDFATVQIVDANDPAKEPPTVHLACSPAQQVRVGQEVTFKARSFRTAPGEVTIEFGDGRNAKVMSDGNAKALAKDGYGATSHAYAKPGTYIATAECTGANGYRAVSRVLVEVA